MIGDLCWSRQGRAREGLHHPRHLAEVPKCDVAGEQVLHQVKVPGQSDSLNLDAPGEGAE